MNAARTAGMPCSAIVSGVQPSARCTIRTGRGELNITPGHLQCRGHWIAGAYFRRPELDLKTGDGWMRTGDIAVIDPDNTLHIVDPAKDVIKPGVNGSVPRHWRKQQRAIRVCRRPPSSPSPIHDGRSGRS